MIEDITPIILVKNASLSISATLDALTSFKYVVVLDNASSDDTKKKALSYPNVLYYFEERTLPFNVLRTIANEYSVTDYVLHIDADEVLLYDAIPSTKELNPLVGYIIRLENYYKGKYLSGGGETDGWVTRLYNKQYVEYDPKKIIHESLQLKDSKMGVLVREPIPNICLRHYSIPSFHVMLTKIDLYSTLEAQKNPNKISRFPLLRLFTTFCKFFIIKKGYSDGYRGFELAFYRGLIAYFKYKKRDEFTNRR
ncbi:MAG: glycosyltransferase family 2 protein [Desulfovibrionaceae bacterium]